MTCAESMSLVPRGARAYVLALTLLCVALLLPTGIAVGQTMNAVLSGRVVDRSQASVPGAVVTATNVLTTSHLTTQTDTTGYFVFPEILAGTYNLSVEKAGFETLEKTGIVLLTAERRTLATMVLNVGSTRTKVTVAAAATPVQTTTSSHFAVISSSEMAALPVLGNDYMSLTRTLPGSNYKGFGNSELGLQSSTAGFYDLPSEGSALVNTNGVFSSISNVSSDFAPPAIDDIQNVTIQTSSYEPEYGGVQGAIMNVTTKQGTSEYHGNLWYENRNEAYNANDFFNNRNGVPRSRYRFNTIEGTLGGPIYIPGVFNKNKNKLFGFFSFDDEPSTTPAGTEELLFPTAAERSGDFSQDLIPGTNTLYTVTSPFAPHTPLPGNIVPSPMINPEMQKLLGVFPMPNFTTPADVKVSDGEYNWVLPTTDHSPVDQESARIDYTPTQKWHIMGDWERGFFGSTGFSEPGIYEGWVGPQSYNNTPERVELNLTQIISPNMVNEIAGGGMLEHEQTIISPSLLKDFEMSTYGVDIPLAYPAANPYGLLPAVSINGDTGFGYNSRTPLNDHTWGGSAADNLSYVYGSHQMKFGVYYDDEHQNQPHHGGSGNIAGGFDFENPNPNDPNNVGNGLAELEMGLFDGYSDVTNRLDDSNTAKALEWYAQDNWQATKRLSINYGVRLTYDIPQAITGGQGAIFTPSLYSPSEAAVLYQPLANGQYENPLTGALEPAAYEDEYVPGSGNYADGMVSVGTPDYHGIFNSKGLLPAPRFGFAYDLFGNGKTAIRGDIGMFYSMRTFSGTIYGLIINPPAIYYPTQYYGNEATFSTSGGLISPQSITSYDRNAGLPHTYNWSLGIQHQLGFQSVLGVSYVALISKNNPYSINENEVPYGAEFLPQNQNPATDTPLPTDYYVPHPGLSSISDTIWGENTNYNSLEVTLNRRMSHGLEYGIAYTWARNLGGSNCSYIYIPCSLNYGPSGSNNRLTPTFVYDLPNAHWGNFLSRGFLDNWEVSGILSFISGTPQEVSFTTTTGENMTGGGDGSEVIVTGNAALSKSARTFNRYFNTSVFALPSVYAPGDPLTAKYIGTGYTPEFYGPGINDWDLAVTKKFKIKERADADLRIELYNAFNHPSFNSVNTGATFDPTTGQQVNSAFGQLNGDVSPRIIQLELRINF